MLGHSIMGMSSDSLQVIRTLNVTLSRGHVEEAEYSVRSIIGLLDRYSNVVCS